MCDMCVTCVWQEEEKQSRLRARAQRMMQDVKHGSTEGQMLVIGTNGQVKATDKRSSNAASRDGAYVISTPVSE